MPRVGKRTRHLRKIAQEAQQSAPADPVNQKQDDNVVLVPVQEGHCLNILPELSRDLQEWNAMLEEPDSDGPADDDTDDEDWQAIGRTLSRNEDWKELQTSMQLAGASVKRIKPRDGTTRQNIHHRNSILKEAAKGTPSLFTFGFTGRKESAPGKETTISQAEPPGTQIETRC